MEKGRTELEFDEFEKLLGEIPNATSSNPPSEDSEPKRVYLDKSLSSISVNSYKGPLSQKLQNNGRLDEGKNLLSKIQQSPVKGVQPEETHLPDDQSLTSAFAELSFNGGVNVEVGSTPLENCRTVQNYNLSREFQNSLKKQTSPILVVPSVRPLNIIPGTKVSQQTTNLSKVNTEELSRHQVNYFQPIENFSAAVPVAHPMHGFQFLSNLPVPGMQFPVMSDQQQVFLDSQSRLPYLHSQQINQHQINWSNIEEEHCYSTMHQRYLQQMHNQLLEGQHLVPENVNFASKIMSRNPRHPHFDMPHCHQLGQFNQEPFWNNYAMTRSLNQSNPPFSSTDFNTMEVLDKVGLRSFPEKILTRSHGKDTFKAVKFGSVGANESLTDVGENKKILPSGHLRHNLSTPSGGYFPLDNLIPWCLFPDGTDIKSSDLKPLPQKYSSLDEVTGKIYLMAKDQHGCRFLQRKFAEGNPQDVEKIFDEIVNHVVELMTDPFGNYLVQKLLEVCDEDQQKQIIHSITRKSGELVRISCDMHGTRAVQKVIETLKTPEQFSMVVSSLKPGIVTLIKNMNGNHVAQRCLQYLMPEYSEFLFEATTTNCVELATDRHGCCVLQKCLIHSDGEQRRRLIREITSNALILSQDPFGNYVVQFVFELQLPWATIDILDHLEGNFGDLSMQKHSSNVVEKSLKYAAEERRRRIILELIDNSRLDQIMQDPYGNYVIQAALNQSKGSLHAKLVDAIKPHVPVLRTSPYGKKVLSSNSLKK